MRLNLGYLKSLPLSPSPGPIHQVLQIFHIVLGLLLLFSCLIFLGYASLFTHYFLLQFLGDHEETPSNNVKKACRDNSHESGVDRSVLCARVGAELNGRSLPLHVTFEFALEGNRIRNFCEAKINDTPALGVLTIDDTLNLTASLPRSEPLQSYTSPWVKLAAIQY